MREQKPSATAVINTWDAESARWRSLAGGRVCPLFPLEKLPQLPVPGRHNRLNAACAAAAAAAAGCGEEAIVRSLHEFPGLQHRLELVDEKAGRRFYNDSKSTTPESTQAALAAWEGPKWLLAGGHDKGACFRGLSASIVERARGAAFFGAAREKLRAAVNAQDASFPVITTEHLADALAWCWSRSRDGDAILLSPACASYDQFQDFHDRGRRFVSLAVQLCAA
jgi:UDP-N-acetylmuramoylalanine--D-glutamate ligase